ncbi:CCA tRNA nucleotidyltransferase [Candidatus Sulfurimonas baltica]|uniref:CCA tRNA nucleotidyltransferase n=1 Tax=Candidatus Sulfurimonas baltica TaxID=2740404 RepID=A0A7S7RN34_9BACT|nr:CCA tRNA nucleotidyltransferase [Candidatus Sulfurimonas baltica]QOY52124.1 CCA tRNA nucleotidyltransferase [Candidatus Sulfurimonas baltica]
MINYPKKLDVIFDKLYNNNALPILVGGFIRDKILGLNSKDIDIEVYGISLFSKLEELLQEFGSVNSVGKSFGVCKLQYQGYELDFSFPRVDNKNNVGHRGFQIEINPNLDFKTAASRRDFTINAIGYDVKNKILLDPFNGLIDLKNKILRAVNEHSFIEDPLRVLRATQFCARFELSIDEKLFELCKEMVSNQLLNELPKERIFEEIKKLILKSNRPSVGFELLKKFGTNIYTNNIYVLDEISKQLTTNSVTNTVLMLAALCFDYNDKQATDFIRNLTNEKELLNRVLPLIKNHNEINKIFYSSEGNYRLYKLATEVKIEELLILSNAIYFTNNSSNIYEAGEAIYKRAKELNILKEKLPPLLKGKDILNFKIKPSPEFSKILDEAYEAQMSCEFTTHIGAIDWLSNHLKEAKDFQRN